MYLLTKLLTNIMKKFISIIITLMISIACFGKNYSISKAGIEMIKEFEKCELTAYPDAGGWSIGYGHHTKDVKQGMKITKKQADKYFDKGANLGAEYLDVNKKIADKEKAISDANNNIWELKQHDLKEKEYEKMWLEAEAQKTKDNLKQIGRAHV